MPFHHKTPWGFPRRWCVCWQSIRTSFFCARISERARENGKRDKHNNISVLIWGGNEFALILPFPQNPDANKLNNNGWDWRRVICLLSFFLSLHVELFSSRPYLTVGTDGQQICCYQSSVRWFKWRKDLVNLFSFGRGSGWKFLFFICGHLETVRVIRIFHYNNRKGTTDGFCRRRELYWNVVPVML